MGTCKLVVEISGARGLIPRESQGTPGAYVEICFDDQRFRTATQEKNYAGFYMWKEFCYFDVPSNIHELVLEACVYTTNSPILGETSFLGKITLSGASFRHLYGKVPGNTLLPPMYPLRDASGVPLLGGSMELLLNKYIRDETPIRAQQPSNDRSSCSAPMGLCVEVLSAFQLRLKDKQRSTNACVELCFDNLRFCTANKELDTVNLWWDERFYFDVWDPSNLHNLEIEAYVYCVDSSLEHSKTLIGKLRIPADSVRPLSDATSSYYPLERSWMFSRKKGELCLKVYTVDNTSIRTSNTSQPDINVSSNLGCILPNQTSRPHHVPYALLFEITDFFSEDRILGQGGFGVVYKGVQLNGEMIAVKKINISLIPGEQKQFETERKQFENEVYHLMMVKHPNIVQFVGYCYETRDEMLEYNEKLVYAEKTQRLICMEYLPKGSLDKYITEESSQLDWSTRYNIIEGICYGLRHLHDESDKPIIHMDLKPPNILLGEGMIPKITDFGLSRLLDRQQTIHTASLLGTRGYMAPELLQGGTITSKSDIFSLGVIILEIITGHRDYQDITRTTSDDFIQLTLRKWRNVLQGSPGCGSPETDCKQIKRCIQVGLICVSPDRTKRPPIMKVIGMLQGSESIDCDISNEAAT